MKKTGEEEVLHYIRDFMLNMIKADNLAATGRPVICRRVLDGHNMLVAK